MKIATPQLHNFDKDKLAPANEKLASFTVGQLPKNIMKPFMFISTSKLNITYQKLRDRYEYLRRLEPMTPCEPLCPEGWYWDCKTETCKEFDFYPYITNNEIITIITITTKSSINVKPFSFNFFIFYNSYSIIKLYNYFYYL